MSRVYIWVQEGIETPVPPSVKWQLSSPRGYVPARGMVAGPDHGPIKPTGMWLNMTMETPGPPEGLRRLCKPLLFFLPQRLFPALSALHRHFPAHVQGLLRSAVPPPFPFFLRVNTTQVPCAEHRPRNFTFVPQFNPSGTGVRVMPMIPFNKEAAVPQSRRVTCLRASSQLWGLTTFKQRSVGTKLSRQEAAPGVRQVAVVSNIVPPCSGAQGNPGHFPSGCVSHSCLYLSFLRARPRPHLSECTLSSPLVIAPSFLPPRHSILLWAAPPLPAARLSAPPRSTLVSNDQRRSPPDREPLEGLAT